MIFCPLFSGSSGNSIFISSDNAKILIDAGLPGKSIEGALKSIDQCASELDGIFITHEHSDHTKGIGVLSRRYDIPVYANEKTWLAIGSSLGKIKEHNVKIIENNSITLNDIDIVAYNISHDAASPCGYSIYSGKGKACIATDLGCFSEEVEKNIKDADVVLLESNHDVEMLKFGPYPYSLKKRILSDKGHLSNEDCGKAITRILNGKLKTVILGHLSRTNNYPELAYQTVLNVLTEYGIDVSNDIHLSLAKRDMPSCYIEF